MAENTPSSNDVGSPVAASDADNDTLKYSLSGTDAGSFRIGRISGQIRTFDSLDFETKNSYSVTVTADDGNGGTDSIDVTINVIDVNERPTVDTPIADQTMNAGDSTTVSLPGRFSDPDGDTLTYSASTSPPGIATASVNNSASTLTLAALSAGSATITVTAADRSPGHSDRLTASQAFTVTVEETNVPPTFDEVEPATRSVAENTPSGADVGSRVSATDDDGDTLTYSLSGTDAGSFVVDPNDGQIGTSDSLNFEMKNSYSVTVTVDDNNGGTDRIDVTINVTDVNEAPDGKPIANRTLASGVFSRQIDLSRYFSDPDTNDTLIYTAETPASDTDVATVSVERSMLTIERVSVGTATITVTAADRPLDDDERLTATEEFTVTVEAPALPTLPTVTIVAEHSSVTEGAPIKFTLTASSAPAENIMVEVIVTPRGSFLVDQPPSYVTFDVGDTTKELILETDNDDTDELDGSVAAIIGGLGTGYTIGDPGHATTVIRDDDQPDKPTELRANGDLDDGHFKLRWAQDSDASSYNVQYAEEVCVNTDKDADRDDEDDFICGLGNPPMWKPVMPEDITTEVITIDGVSVVEATVGAGLISRKLYRVRVQAVIVDNSEWSDFTLVFPTRRAPNQLGHVVINLGDNVVDKNNGSHEYEYTICEDSITTNVAWGSDTDQQGEHMRSNADVTAIVADIESAIGGFETTVRWVTVANGANIVSATPTDAGHVS